MDLIHGCFKQRRKTLLNNLSAYFEDLSKEEITKELEGIGIAPSVRAEALSLEDFAKLAEAFGGQDDLIVPLKPKKMLKAGCHSNNRQLRK